MKSTPAIIKHIPNFITSMNLLSGCIAIAFSFDPGLHRYAPWFIFLAAAFDFLDGFSARLLHAYSEIGKQLDSLADVVSFGLAPGCLLFQVMHFILNRENPFFSLYSPGFAGAAFLLACFLIPIFGAIRLARFNIDDTQKYSFSGLPIPANAVFFASIVLLLYTTRVEAVRSILLNKYVLLSFSALFSFLMISRIPMISLKFKNLALKENFGKYILIAGSVILVVIGGYAGLAAVIPFYILVSLLFGSKPVNARLLTPDR